MEILCSLLHCHSWSEKNSEVSLKGFSVSLKMLLLRKEGRKF